MLDPGIRRLGKAVGRLTVEADPCSATTCANCYSTPSDAAGTTGSRVAAYEMDIRLAGERDSRSHISRGSVTAFGNTV